VEVAKAELGNGPVAVPPAALDSLGLQLAADMWTLETSLRDLDVLAVRKLLVTAALNEQHSIEGAYALVVSHVAHRVQAGDFSPESADKFAQLAARLIAYVSRIGAVADVREVDREKVLAWLYAPLLGEELKYPKARTLSNRRWAADLFFSSLRGLGLYEGDPLLDAPRPSRGEKRHWRGLTDVEIEICRHFCRRSTRDLRGPVRWALAETGATTGEIPFVEPLDLDLEKRAVWLDAPSRYAPRWGYFTEWGLEQVERLLNEQRDLSGPLAYTGSGRPSSRQSSTVISLTRVFRRAQLLPDPLLKVSYSIRSWRARQFFLAEHFDLDEVAHRLGVNGLDAARGLVDLPWGRCAIPPLHRRPA
jgi:integrase